MLANGQSRQSEKRGGARPTTLDWELSGPPGGECAGDCEGREQSDPPRGADGRAGTREWARAAGDARMHFRELARRLREPRGGEEDQLSRLVQLPRRTDRPALRTALGGAGGEQAAADQVNGAVESAVEAPDRTDPKPPPRALRPASFPASAGSAFERLSMVPSPHEGASTVMLYTHIP